jgi:ABC-2 type transport system ATP-binding protein
MNEFCTSVAIMERGALVIAGRIDDVNRRVMGDTLLVVEVLGEPDVFLNLVETDHRAGAIERKNGAFEFRFQGDADAASDLLTALVHQGVRVASFVRRKDNLEDLFLKVGSRELS